MPIAPLANENCQSKKRTWIRSGGLSLLPRVTHIVLLTQVSDEDSVSSKDSVMKFRQIRSWGWSLLGHDFVLHSVQCVATTSVI